jgi:hypothetical protein
VSSLDEGVVWETARDDEGRHIALEIALYKYRLERGLDPEWGDCPACTLGSAFAIQFEAVCHGQPASLRTAVFRAMLETLDDLNLGAVHALRTSNSGGAPQRTRGLEKGWRRDVNRDVHLHYWKGPAGIEFGWVAYPHNDFQLPE